MLNYAGEYGEYCDACKAAVTVIRSIDTASKSCLEWLTISYIISDSAYLILVQFCRQTNMDKPGNVAYSLTALHRNCLAVIYVLILARLHKKAVLLHYVTPCWHRTGFMHSRCRSTRSTRPRSLA